MTKITLATLGSGFRTLDSSLLPNSALNTPEKIARVKSETKADIWMGVIENQSSLYQKLGIDVGVDANVSSGDLFDVSLAERTSFGKQIVVNEEYLYFMIKKRVEYSEALTNNCFLHPNIYKQLNDIELKDELDSPKTSKNPNKDGNSETDSNLNSIGSNTKRRDEQLNQSPPANESHSPQSPENSNKEEESETESSSESTGTNTKAKDKSLSYQGLSFHKASVVDKHRDNFDSFYSTYGDRFISEIAYGCEAIFVLKLMAKSSESNKGVNQGASVNVQAKIPTSPLIEVKGGLGEGINSTNINHQEHYAGGYWIHTMGIPNAKSYIPDTKDLSSLLQSATDLLKFIDEKGVSSAVPLAYRTIPYSAVTFDSRAVLNSNLNKVLLRYEMKMYHMRTIFVKITSLHSTLKLYRDKYEAVWEKMDRESLKYRNDNLFEIVWNNRIALKQLMERFDEIKNDMALKIISAQKLKQFDESIKTAEDGLKKLIKELPEYITYKRVVHCEYNPEKDKQPHSQEFRIYSKAKSLFWTAKRLSPQPKEKEETFTYDVSHAHYAESFNFLKESLTQIAKDAEKLLQGIEAKKTFSPFYEHMDSKGEYQSHPGEHYSLVLTPSKNDEKKPFPFQVDIYEVPEESNSLSLSK